MTDPKDSSFLQVQDQLVPIWREVLGEDCAAVDRSFEELGGDSISAPQILHRVSERLGVRLEIEQLLELDTLERIAAFIAEVRDQPQPPGDGGSLFAEVSLDKALCPRCKPVARRRIREVLVTGATGFVGANVVATLLDRTHARVHCLVRGREDARQRLRSALERYGLAAGEAFERRVVAWSGDLAQPGLGLAEAQRAELAERVDSIFHIGAWVNFTYSYAALAPTNIGGLKEIIALASRGRPKPIHFLSSIAAFEAETLAEARTVDETTTLDDGEGDCNGYARSKWVAEKILGLARARGVPVNLYRPLYIGGHSDKAINHTKEFLWALVKGCVELRQAPALDTEFNITPVDYVANAMVWTAFQDRLLNRTFHLLNPEPLPWPTLVQWLEDYGYPVEIRKGWFEANRAAISRPGHALGPFIPLFERVLEAARQQGTDGMPRWRADGHRTSTLLRDEASLEFPAVDATLMRRYFDVLTAQGFLPAPAPGSRTETRPS